MSEEPPPVTLILGEAPESDDDECVSSAITTENNSNVSKRKAIPVSIDGMETAGEAIELDEDVELHNTHSYIPHKQPVQKGEGLVNSGDVSQPLRKLQERNIAAYESLISFKRNIVNSANHELNNVNQHLLKSQIELQHTLANIRSIKKNLNDYKKKLNDVVLANYIPPINVEGWSSIKSKKK